MYILLALGGLLIIAITGTLWLRRRRTRPSYRELPKSGIKLSPQGQIDKLRSAGNFWGVGVQSHCRASSRLAGRQYPFDSPPPLPVDGCSETCCACTLIGLPERRKLHSRRTGRDRREGMRMESNDRRSDRPRRRGDVNSWSTYQHL